MRRLLRPAIAARLSVRLHIWTRPTVIAEAKEIISTMVRKRSGYHMLGSASPYHAPTVDHSATWILLPRLPLLQVNHNSNLPSYLLENAQWHPAYIGSRFAIGKIHPPSAHPKRRMW